MSINTGCWKLHRTQKISEGQRKLANVRKYMKVSRGFRVSRIGPGDENIDPFIAPECVRVGGRHGPSTRSGQVGTWYIIPAITMFNTNFVWYVDIVVIGA